jgi:NH3-dependent NAD+ synthetase
VQSKLTHNLDRLIKYMALKVNNKIYIEIIEGIAQKPPSPELFDESVEVL